jgi:hypothetical protein
MLYHTLLHDLLPPTSTDIDIDLEFATCCGVTTPDVSSLRPENAQHWVLCEQIWARALSIRARTSTSLKKLYIRWICRFVAPARRCGNRVRDSNRATLCLSVLGFKPEEPFGQIPILLCSHAVCCHKKSARYSSSNLSFSLNIA